MTSGLSATGAPADGVQNQQDLQWMKLPMADQASEHHQLLQEALHTATTLVPLKSLKPGFLRELFAEVQVDAVVPGQVLFEAGSYDHQHLYLLHGVVELQYNDGRSETISGDRSELPLAHQMPRPCKAVASTDCGILRINSEYLDKTLSWSQIAQFLLAEISVERNYDEDYDWMQTVLNSNLFFKVPPINVEQIFSRLKPVVVFNGDAIIRQGEIGNCCYFIKEGTASVVRHSEATVGGGAAGSQHLADIGIGRCFGEDALINETVRNATVTMTSDGVLMRLEKNDFMLLLKEPEVNEISCAALKEQVSPAVLIDVRTEDEYAGGHLEASANIPLGLLCVKKRLLARDKLYVFYCDTGRRSRAAAHLLSREGFTTAAIQGGVRGAGSLRKLSTQQDYILRDGELVVGQ